jgi:hypothetical protein
MPLFENNSVDFRFREAARVSNDAQSHSRNAK